jgi:hypothetical protein
MQDRNLVQPLARILSLDRLVTSGRLGVGRLL